MLPVRKVSKSESLYSPQDAWEAYESRSYQLAAHIWLALLPTARELASLCRYQFGYAAALMAQKQFHEAMAICEELFESTHDGLCLHLLGCLAKQKGLLDTARSHFIAEQTRLGPAEHLAHALNAYQLAAIALEQDKIPVAFHYARLSLDYIHKGEFRIVAAYALELFARIRIAMKDPEKAQDCSESAREALVGAPAHPLQECGDIRLAALLLQPLAHWQPPDAAGVDEEFGLAGRPTG